MLMINDECLVTFHIHTGMVYRVMKMSILRGRIVSLYPAQWSSGVIFGTNLIS